MSSAASPSAQFADMEADDKPRVLVDGPGGSDTKQGAKIACLECRSAKIKCSAPTDGQVPCKRCVKHQRECLFEKHKRGRKPNKRFSVPSDLRAGGNMDGDSFSSQPRPSSSGDSKGTKQHPSRNGNGRTSSDDSQGGKADATFSGTTHSDNSRRRFGEPAAWNQTSVNYGQAVPARGAPQPYGDDRFYSSQPKYAQPGAIPVSMSAPSGLNQAAVNAYAYHPNQAHTPHHHGHAHQSHPSPGYSNSRHAPDHPSPGRWRDHPPPPIGSSPHSSNSATAPSSQHGSFAHSRDRPYVHNAPAPSHSYAHWDNLLGSERFNKSRMDLSPSRRADQQPLQHPHPSSQTHASSQYQRADAASHKGPNPAAGAKVHHSNNNNSNSNSNARSSPKGRTPRKEPSHLAHHRSSSRNGPYDPDMDEDFEDEQDELEDDADATREEHDNVLSNPLKLLAQASDAAAARIEGGKVEPTSRNSLAAVETMGLLQPPLPSNRMAVSAAVNLTGLGRPLYGGRQDDPRSQRGWPASRVLPPILQQGKPIHPSDTSSDQSARSQPAFLRDNMRSKSFPVGELPRIDAPNSSVEEEDAATGQTRPVSSAKGSTFQLGRSNVLTPSTLDHDAWEYREGKAQARRGYGSGTSPGAFSADAVTTGSSTSAGALPGTKTTAVSAINGASPGEIIESPAEEVTTAMLGKRKRGRSRIARGGGLPSRRRKLAEWDTDAENADGIDDEATEQTKVKQVTIAAAPKAKEGGGMTSGGEGEAGASRKGYFNLSLFHSKNDDTEGLDPVELGLVELKELERLFDIFFARINPVLDLFDPFLHSVAFVRMRSAFLTTVISSMAARFSDTTRDAEIASILDKHWQEKLLPMILLGGYKSVEISQAFLILTTYSRPTNRLVDDRSWQYLGFAIRTATEVGVNRKVTPSENLLGNEQVARRVRNRERLWYNLFLYDRTLSAQTGRPWTISEDRMIVQSSMWHRQDFALPEDVSLVSLIKLRRITAQHTEAFDTYLSSPDRFDEAQTTTALGVGGQNPFDRRLAGLEFFRKNANADLEKWKETWCINTDEKVKEVDTSTAAGKYLIRWAPTAKLFYYHSRLLINSLVLGATEQYEEFLSGSSVSVDCWTSAISLIDTVLNDFPEEAVVTWSNDRVVMAVYAAVSAVRMSNLQYKYAFADKETLLALVRRLATSMTKAGKMPRHRNGSATPYGRYLKSVLSAFEPETGDTNSSAQIGVGASFKSPGKDSEQATSITTSSLAPGDSRSAAATPSAAHTGAGADVPPKKDAATAERKGNEDVVMADAAQGQIGTESEKAKASSDLSSSGVASSQPQGLEAGLVPTSEGSHAITAQSILQLKPEDVVAQIEAGKTLDVPLIISNSVVSLDPQAASDLAAVNALTLGDDANKLISRMPLDATSASPDVLAAAAAGAATGSASSTSGVAWPTSDMGGAPARPASASSSAAASGGVLSTPESLMLANTLASGATPQTATSNDTSVVAAAVQQQALNANAAAVAAASAAMPNVVDDPESLERMWDYMTAFEHTSFWQPQSTWNISSSGNVGGGNVGGGGGGGGGSSSNHGNAL